MTAPEKSISVIVPLYNCEKYLAMALNSLAAQSYNAYEVLIIDDGSTDTSPSIAKDYCKEYHHFHYFRKENGGAASARNYGISVSSGDYLMFIDPDDEVDNDLLSVMIELSDEHEEVDICICGANSIVDGRIVPNPALSPHIGMVTGVTNRKDIESELFQVVAGQPWDKLFSRDLVVRNGLKFQDLANTNDAYFVYASLINARKIAFSDRKLIHYRYGFSESTQDRKINNPLCFAEAMSKIYLDVVSRSDLDSELNSSFKKWALELFFSNFAAAANRNQETARLIYDQFATDYEKYGLSKLDEKSLPPAMRLKVWAFKKGGYRALLAAYRTRGDLRFSSTGSNVRLAISLLIFSFVYRHAV